MQLASSLQINCGKLRWVLSCDVEEVESSRELKNRPVSLLKGSAARSWETTELLSWKVPFLQIPGDRKNRREASP